VVSISTTVSNDRHDWSGGPEYAAATTLTRADAGTCPPGIEVDDALEMAELTVA